MFDDFGLVPLVRARGFGPLPMFVERRAGEAALLNVFRAARLPLALETEPDTPVPVTAMIELFERGEREVGKRTFGLEVGERMTHLGYGDWMRVSLQAPNLMEGLARLCATSWSHQRGFALSFARSGPVWIWRAMPLFGSGMQTQFVDHLIPPMIQFVQHYLGRDWRPVWVEVTYPRDPGAFEVEDRIGSPMRFGRRGVAVAIRPEDALRVSPVGLDARWSGADACSDFVGLKDILSGMAPDEASESVRSVSAVVALRLLDGHSDIEGAARLAGLSIQTLQRRLRQEGYSYRQILNAARQAKAMALLRDTRLSVSEVAQSLGYEEHASFTRAFSRWMGMSPVDFRKG